MTNEDKIKKWLVGELPDSERKEFESTEEFAKIHRLLKAVDNFKAPEYDVDNEYSRLPESLIQHKRSISLYKRISPLMRIAAIFIVVLTISYFFYDHFNATTSNQGWMAKQTEVYLPDSSFVSLNKGSQIKFSENNWDKERNVELNGEAFFRVKKGSQFNVKTQQGTVTVLGTEFGVKDWDKYYEVTCYSGLVKVITEQNSLVLKPNAAYRLVNGEEENYTISSKSEPDWLNGESSFKSVPLRFVINELERQYKVSVETQNIDLNQLFTGGFSHMNLEIALESITIPVNLNYTINGNKIVITFEHK
jgi:transmembrane sensor